MFTKALKVAVLVVASATAVLADSPPVPTTLPTTVPTTQPSADMKVLVLPFAPVQPGEMLWIARAVQQSISADLSRPTTGQPLQALTDGTAADTTAEAIELGKNANARFVVFGSYQVIDPNLKITGQVIEVSTGRVIGGLKSTGSVRELFDMQDRLAFQARWALGMNQLAEKKLAPVPVPRPTIQPNGPILTGADRYDGSNLSYAVAENKSLIDRYDAAGTSYRNQYYDSSYYPMYPMYSYGYSYGYYGGYYGGYYPARYGGGGTCYNPPTRCPTPTPGPSRQPIMGIANNNGTSWSLSPIVGNNIAAPVQMAGRR